jgi:hypothetical protein
VAVIVVLDGSPEHGLVARHVASGVEVRYAGRATADEAIAQLVERDFAGSGAGTLVITDDIELSDIVRHSGARTARNGWLISRLERQRPASPSVGRAMPPAIGNGPSRGQAAGTRPPRSPRRVAGPGSRAPPDSPADEAPPWAPGRGATRKRGNAKRRPTAGR